MICMGHTAATAVISVPNGANVNTGNKASALLDLLYLLPEIFLL
jgi:hypothetical protein